MANIKFYFDAMVTRPLANELIKRGYEVIMANDVNMTEKTDPEHLQYATEQDAVMVTLDQRFAGQIASQIEPVHAGLICWTPEYQSIGNMLRALMEFAEQHENKDIAGQVFWLH